MRSNLGVMPDKASVGKNRQGVRAMKLRTGLQHKQPGQKLANGGEKIRKAPKIYPSPFLSTQSISTALESGLKKAKDGNISSVSASIDKISKPWLLDGVESGERSKELAVEIANGPQKAILLHPLSKCEGADSHAGCVNNRGSPLLKSSRKSGIEAHAGQSSSQRTKDSAVHRVSKASETVKKPSPSHHHHHPNSKSKDEMSLESDCKSNISAKAVRLVTDGGKRCKYPWCATNNSENASPRVAPSKMYLVAKRPLLKAQINNARRKDRASSAQKENFAGPSYKIGHPASSSVDTLQRDGSQSSDKNAEASRGFRCRRSFKIGSSSFAKRIKDQADGGIVLESGEASEQMAKKEKWGQLRRARRAVITPSREREQEAVRLRKQLIQARKEAPDWMIDTAVENAIQRLAHNGEIKVKILVEAYESIISKHGSHPKKQDSS